MGKLLPDNNSFKAYSLLPALDKIIQYSLFTFVAFAMFSISLTQISFAIGALSWLLKVHLTQTWKEISGTLVGIAILCFCLACVLAIITSVDLESSIKHLKKLVQFVIFFWVVNAVKDRKQRDLLIGLLIIAGLVVALNGLSPYLSTDYSISQRLKGTLSKGSTFSGVLMLAGLVALGQCLFYKPKKYWLMGSAGVIALCLLMTMARQAWLGSLLGAVFLVFYWNKKYLLIFPLLLIVTLLFASEQVTDRIYSFKNFKDGSFQQRVSSWKGGWEIFKDHPVTGCGFKCVDYIHSQYPDPTENVARFRGMHSNIFQLLVDTGVAGFGTWLSIWVVYFIEIFKRLRALAEEEPQDNTLGILLGGSAAVLAFLMGGFFETNIYDSEVAMFLYFIMGLSLAKVEKTPASSLAQ
ncbi:O-antigen ligase family protein [Nitrospinae bacterium]|nr:O-antigen ligase family protein [Nitrospinota bacterium]